ncbi:hypothetical protein NXU96_22395 [Phocaeicola vulgatus]|nr:hypothetical protein [Phocaeicola vulgatus]
MENIDVHDGMAIGFYLVKGMNNLVLNYDALIMGDGYSEGDSGNVDGFEGIQIRKLVLEIYLEVVGLGTMEMMVLI